MATEALNRWKHWSTEGFQVDVNEIYSTWTRRPAYFPARYAPLRSVASPRPLLCAEDTMYRENMSTVCEVSDAGGLFLASRLYTVFGAFNQSVRRS